jgi:hypothetical protein
VFLFYGHDCCYFFTKLAKINEINTGLREIDENIAFM